LEVCEVFQIPHSHYLGGPLQWTDLDREKAEMYLAWKREVCPDCGTRESEWDPEQGGHRHAFISGNRRCAGCELLESERDAIDDDEKGIKVFLTPNVAVMPLFLAPEAA
jgi:hypothetical protein